MIFAQHTTASCKGLALERFGIRELTLPNEQEGEIADCEQGLAMLFAEGLAAFGEHFAAIRLRLEKLAIRNPNE